MLLSFVPRIAYNTIAAVGIRGNIVVTGEKPQGHFCRKSSMLIFGDYGMTHNNHSTTIVPTEAWSYHSPQLRLHGKKLDLGLFAEAFLL